MPAYEGFGRINETQIIKEISQKMHRLGRLSDDVEVQLQYRLPSGFVHNCVWSARAGAAIRGNASL
jgi:hypothetical protein